MNKNKLTRNLPGQKQQSPQSPAPPCSPLAITSTKGNGAKNDLPQDTNNGEPGHRPVFDLFFKLVKQKNPSANDVDRLHRQMVSSPDAWSLVSIWTETTRWSLVKKLAGNDAMSALLLAELDILAKQLGYDSAPPLERMLIEHLLTVRLRLIQVENCYNNTLSGGSITLAVGRFWQEFLASAQIQFLRASEMLARIRRLARNSPALQINIAHEGGKQANIQSNAPASGQPITGS
jgi:hypothetical protein